MATLDDIDFNFADEVKYEYVDEYDILSTDILPKIEDEITIEDEVFHKEVFKTLTKYEDLIVESPRLCSLCDRVFSNSYSFLQHSTAHLRISLPKLNTYSCSICSDSFYTANHLAEHERVHLKNNNNKLTTYPVSKKDIKTRKLAKQVEISHRPKLECNICGIIIGSVPNLKRHIINMHEKKHKKCKHCGKTIKERYYGTHLKKVHQKGKVKCDLCCKYFKSKACVLQHKLYIHQKAYSMRVEYHGIFKCDICHAMYKEKKRLAKHVKTCQGVHCELCGAKLKNKQIFKNHMRWAHYDDGSIHSCDLCGKVFKSPYGIKTHKKNSHPSAVT